MNAQTYGINRFSLLRQWSCSLCESKWWLMSLLYCCFVTFISTKVRHWIYYSACVLFVDVGPYKLTVLRHHWHFCICSYCHNNIISSGLPPVFLECTSIVSTVSCTYCVHFLQNDVQLKRMQIVAHNMWEFPSASYISGSIVVELADNNIHW